MNRVTSDLDHPRRDRDVTELLIAAATQLFAENGFASTSVQQVVSAAQVTKGAMYYYFDSKDGLLYEIYARLLRLQMARLQMFADSKVPIEERVRDAAADVAITSLANLDSVKVFLRSIPELNAEKQATVRTERRAYHELFRTLIRDGQAEGKFDPKVDATLVVNYFFGAIHYLTTWYNKDGDLSPAEIGSAYSQLLMASLQNHHNGSFITAE